MARSARGVATRVEGGEDQGELDQLTFLKTRQAHLPSSDLQERISEKIFSCKSRAFTLQKEGRSGPRAAA
jgi:hypothetical protein